MGLRLRLDDGSIITSSSGREGEGSSASSNVATKISSADAFDKGLLTEKDVERLETLTAFAKSLAPAPVVVAPTAPAPGPSASKKQRMDSGHLSDAALGLGGVQDWAPKAKQMLEKIAKVIGPNNKPIFWNPVNPALLPDYYKVVVHPKFFGEIEEKLRNCSYATPHDFCADVRLSFNNCFLYNPVNNPYRILGEKASAEYEKMWAASGFERMDAGSFAAAHQAAMNTGPGKRATAGIARQKYEPEKFEGSKPKSQKAGGSRIKKEDLPVSDARKAEIGTLLQSEAMEQHMEALMTLLPPEMLEGGAEGEFELDFDSLDDATMRKIDVFLQGIFGPPAGGGGGGGGGQQQQRGGRGGGAAAALGSEDMMDDDEDDEDVSDVDLDDESDD